MRKLQCCLLIDADLADRLQAVGNALSLSKSELVRRCILLAGVDAGQCPIDDAADEAPKHTSTIILDEESIQVIDAAVVALAARYGVSKFARSEAIRFILRWKLSDVASSAAARAQNAVAAAEKT